jgi:hypothetical protein
MYAANCSMPFTIMPTMFIVQAPVAGQCYKAFYDYTVITIVDFDRKTFIVQWPML